MSEMSFKNHRVDISIFNLRTGTAVFFVFVLRPSRGTRGIPRSSWRFDFSENHSPETWKQLIQVWVVRKIRRFDKSMQIRLFSNWVGTVFFFCKEGIAAFILSLVATFSFFSRPQLTLTRLPAKSWERRVKLTWIQLQLQVNHWNLELDSIFLYFDSNVQIPGSYICWNQEKPTQFSPCGHP